MGLLAKINGTNLLMVCFILGAARAEAPAHIDTYTPLKTTENVIEEMVKEPEVNLLLEAIIQVESRGKEDCIGDKHLGRPSIGVLQIRPIMVREVNRILKKQKIKKKYSLDDRYSREKSIEMFYIWKDYYHSNDSDEIIARCWNGGPKGWKRKATDHYWNKVKNEMETGGSSM